MRYMLVYRCLSTAFLLTIIFRQRAASWSSLVTDVVDIVVAILVFAIIRKFIWTSSSLLTTELHGRWGLSDTTGISQRQNGTLYEILWKCWNLEVL